MQLITLPCGPLAVNTYLVHDDEGARAPSSIPAMGRPCSSGCSGRGSRAASSCSRTGISTISGGVQALSAATGAPVAIHEDDADKLQSSRKSLALMIGRPLPKAQASRLLHDGDTLRCGALSFRVLHTPGHSEGGVCYVLEREGVIFCGDTLFFEGVGRTDFPGADYGALGRSVRGKLFALEGDYALYPGHGEATTLAHERRCNPYFGAAGAAR